MKYDHPTIQLECPAPGHYIVTGHNPRPVPTEKGYVVPSGTVHISPEVPSELLFAILQDRGDFPPLLTISTDEAPEAAPAGEEEKPRRGGRPRKAAAPAGEEGEAK